MIPSGQSFVGANGSNCRPRQLPRVGTAGPPALARWTAERQSERQSEVCSTDPGVAPAGRTSFPSVYHGQCLSVQPGEQIQNRPAEPRPPEETRRPLGGRSLETSPRRRGKTVRIRARRLSPKLSDLQIPTREPKFFLKASRPRLRPGRRGQPRAPNPARVGADTPSGSSHRRPASKPPQAAPALADAPRARPGPALWAGHRGPSVGRGDPGGRSGGTRGRERRAPAGSLSLTRERHSSEAEKTARRVSLRHPERLAPTDERPRQPPRAEKPKSPRPARVRPERRRGCAGRGGGVRGEASSCRPRSLPGPSRALPGPPSPEPARLGERSSEPRRQEPRRPNLGSLPTESIGQQRAGPCAGGGAWGHLSPRGTGPRPAGGAGARRTDCGGGDRGAGDRRGQLRARPDTRVSPAGARPGRPAPGALRDWGRAERGPRGREDPGAPVPQQRPPPPVSASKLGAEPAPAPGCPASPAASRPRCPAPPAAPRPGGGGGAAPTWSGAAGPRSPGGAVTCGGGSGGGEAGASFRKGWDLRARPPPPPLPAPRSSRGLRREAAPESRAPAPPRASGRRPPPPPGPEFLPGAAPRGTAEAPRSRARVDAPAAARGRAGRNRPGRLPPRQERVPPASDPARPRQGAGRPQSRVLVAPAPDLGRPGAAPGTSGSRERRAIAPPPARAPVPRGPAGGPPPPPQDGRGPGAPGHAHLLWSVAAQGAGFNPRPDPLRPSPTGPAHPARADVLLRPRGHQPAASRRQGPSPSSVGAAHLLATKLLLVWTPLRVCAGSARACLRRRSLITLSTGSVSPSKSHP
ncbi:basic proline-rich protein-like [Lutra lutra]|uniref:basic proline-rich protein-like n=1 Tax=Lutra lutra TaxID=9657 RepID=UPI001FD18D53|nr:basic proline-rich protein-like [Lutra lutra]